MLIVFFVGVILIYIIASAMIGEEQNDPRHN